MRMSMRGARDLILLICAVISTQVWRVYLVRATAGHGIIWMVQMLRMDRRDPTAWLGWEDSNSEMSSQNIPLKGGTDFRWSFARPAAAGVFVPRSHERNNSAIHPLSQ